MRTCIWHQYYYRNFRSKILYNLLRLMGIHKGEVWTSYGSIKGKDSTNQHVTYEVEINTSDMGRIEFLVIREE